MPAINKLPVGGASSGAAGLNIFTQSNEPEKKDGIWIQTGNQYEKIITDARIMVNTDNGVISNKRDLHYSGTAYNAPCYYNYSLDCEYYNGSVYGLVDCQNSSETIRVLFVRIDNNVITTILNDSVTSSGKMMRYINKYMGKLYITYLARSSDYNASTLLVLNNQMDHEYLSVPIAGIYDVIEYNNTLLFIGYNEYCQFDGNSFTTKYTTTDNIRGNCVVYNGYIYASSNFGLYRWDTNNITLVLSSFRMNGQMCVYNNSIYLYI